MTTSISLPALESGATHATVEHYHKQPGDQIVAGEPLAIVATDRFEWDVPATTSGTIAAIVAQPGSTVAVGAALITITSDTAPNPGDRSDPPTDRRARITPLARKIAALHDLDVSTVHGSGRGGAITQADVRAMIEASGFRFQASAEQRDSGTAGQRDSGQLLDQIKQHLIPKSKIQNRVPGTGESNIPFALSAVEVDLIEVERGIERDRARLARRGIELTPIVVVARAAVAALLEHRAANSAWSDDGIIVRGRVQLGVIDQMGALRMVADASELSTQGLARALQNGSADHDPTFTIGQSRSRWGHDLIDGHAAALTVGAVERRAVVVERDGHITIEARPMAILTLTYDARVLDQMAADAFLMAIKARLERSGGVC